MFSYLNYLISVHDAIQQYHARYPVTAHMWLSFLYPKCQFNLQHPSTGLFKGELLVRVRYCAVRSARMMITQLLQSFQCIFTSPSSAREDLEGEDTIDEPHGSKARKSAWGVRTCCHVAGLLKMRSVQPCAIAYTAVQVRAYPLLSRC